MTTLHRQMFFAKQVRMKVWKDSMSGKNESKLIKAIESLGYKHNKDFFRQYPIAESVVADVAFPKVQVVVEMDGSNHRTKVQRKKDRYRDNILNIHNWRTIRIPEQKFDKNPSFYKFLIDEVVIARTEEYNSGKVPASDIPEFDQNG